MDLQPGDYIQEDRGHLKVRLSDPRGIIIDFEGSQIEFEKFMDAFPDIEKYMKARAQEWDEAMKGKGLPAIDMKM